MIASLRGAVIEKGVDAAVIEVGGVGYAVTLTAQAVRALPAVGAETRLAVYPHAVQDGPAQLYGFVDVAERRLFEALLSVQGVGPKVGIAILSGLAAGDLVRAIAGGDVARLTQIRGVGRKLAERLAVELRDKIGAVVAGAGREGGGVPFAAAPGGRMGEVWGALVALGYKPAEFEGRLAGLDPEQPSAELVKQALAALRRK